MKTKVDRILLVLIFISLFPVLIIQIMPYFSDITYPGQKIFNNPLSTEVPIIIDEGALFGNLHLESENEVSLPMAKVMVNQVEVADFSEGTVLIRVYEGDSVEINSMAYQRDIRYQISNLSSNIDQSKLNHSVTLYAEIKGIGVIHFK